MQVTSALLAAFAACLATTTVQAGAAAPALTPQFAPGQTYSNVFSILHSLTADGYDESARRNGGSADYTVLASDPQSYRLHVQYRYDGRPRGDGEVRVVDDGRTNCHQRNGAEDCEPYLDGSGLVYNPLLWGPPPRQLKSGMSWTVTIKPAWELGGAEGVQKVTVVSVDAATGTVVLLREGESQGLFGEGETPQRQLTRGGKEESVTLTAGTAHWRGYTTIVKGVIFSDALLVTRDDTVRDAAGASAPARERWIMLLNAAPFPTLS
jgi:hypothetical protein